jgi:hypothetical protein
MNNKHLKLPESIHIFDVHSFLVNIVSTCFEMLFLQILKSRFLVRVCVALHIMTATSKCLFFLSKQFYSSQQLHVFVSEQKFTRTRMIEMTCTTQNKTKQNKKTDRLLSDDN